MDGENIDQINTLSKLIVTNEIGVSLQTLMKIIIACFLFFAFFVARSQELKTATDYQLVCIGFYNLENLFDTIVDTDTTKILRDDFTPLGDKKFTSQRYSAKLENMARVIAAMGTESQPDGPAVLGVCEIENRRVLEDLVKMPSIAKRNYQIVHYDSPDERGVDVGLIYQPKYFTLTSSSTHTLTDPADRNFHTRDQLIASGMIGGEKFHFLVAHWPSRRGGEMRSRPHRIRAAQLALHLMDSLQRADADSKIIYMGDLNDDPVSHSIAKVIQPKEEYNQVNAGDYFNPMKKLFDQGIGTLAYRDNWNLFDQLICSSTLVDKSSEFKSFTYYKAKVFNADFLRNPSGNFAGYPFRTYVGSSWQGGFSDHFPVYLYLVKAK